MGLETDIVLLYSLLIGLRMCLYINALSASVLLVLLVLLSFTTHDQFCTFSSSLTGHGEWWS
jgi:hypothetical protein